MYSNTPSSENNIVVCALYRFVHLDNFETLRQPLLDTMLQHQVRGTLLLASEGINGTVAGSQNAINAVLNWLREDPRLDGIEYKQSYTNTPPFKRTKVKLKQEIVTMGVQGIDPRHTVGTYLNAEEWNALLQDPEVVLVDTRNDYEYQVGSFKNAINPDTKTFREFPQYVQENLNPEQHKKIAMFCTGGIRCEKSTAFMKEQGFEEVYHLKGGILQYLEDTLEEESLWQGECFVFDDRVTVNHQLEPGNYDQCHACRLPITEHDKQSEHYQKGVSCPYCYQLHTLEQKQRFAEREKQMQLAFERNEPQLGEGVSERIQYNKQRKYDNKAEQRHRDLDN